MPAVRCRHDRPALRAVRPRLCQMARLDRLERVTNLLMVLLDAGVPISLREIANRVPGYPDGADARRQAFERDKRVLREEGVPVLVEPVAGADQLGYRVDPDAYYLPDLDLDPEEQAALNLAVAGVHLGEPVGAPPWPSSGHRPGTDPGGGTPLVDLAAPADGFRPSRTCSRPSAPPPRCPSTTGAGRATSTRPDCGSTAGAGTWSASTGTGVRPGRSGSTGSGASPRRAARDRPASPTGSTSTRPSPPCPGSSATATSSTSTCSSTRSRRAGWSPSWGTTPCCGATTTARSWCACR